MQIQISEHNWFQLAKQKMNKNKEETKIHSTYPFTMTHVCAIDNNMQLVNHQENVFFFFCFFTIWY